MQHNIIQYRIPSQQILVQLSWETAYVMAVFNIIVTYKFTFFHLQNIRTHQKNKK